VSVVCTWVFCQVIACLCLRLNHVAIVDSCVFVAYIHVYIHISIYAHTYAFDIIFNTLISKFTRQYGFSAQKQGIFPAIFHHEAIIDSGVFIACRCVCVFVSVCVCVCLCLCMDCHMIETQTQTRNHVTKHRHSKETCIFIAS